MRGRHRMPTMQAPVARAAAVTSAAEKGRDEPSTHLPFPWPPPAKISGLFGMEETLKILKPSPGQPRGASELMQRLPHTLGCFASFGDALRPKSFIAAGHPKVFGLPEMRSPDKGSQHLWSAASDPLPASKCSGIKGLVTHRLCSLMCPEECHPQRLPERLAACRHIDGSW